MQEKRVSISKKTRFEVFKRDSFCCQYCGNSAPDALLEVDHIKPVKEGGKGNVTNLITSCKDCNRGKGARLLGDKSVLKKQQKQLEELNDRRIQLEMMMEWRQGLLELEDKQVSIVVEYYQEHTGWRLTDSGRNRVRGLIKKHSLTTVLDSIEIAISKYPQRDASNRMTQETAEMILPYVKKVCTVKQLEIAKPYIKDLFYIRGMMRNRFSYINEWKAMDYLEDAHLAGASIARLKGIVTTASNWTDFCLTIEALKGGK